MMSSERDRVEGAYSLHVHVTFNATDTFVILEILSHNNPEALVHEFYHAQMMIVTAAYN